MGLLRLLFFAAIGYVLYRLLFARSTTKTARPDVQPGAGRTPGGQVQDVLMEDPICHTYVPSRQALSLDRDGQTYYFCSEQCREAFKNQK